MFLVPPEAFLGQLDPYTKQMTELDAKMDQILKNKDLDEFNKALQYQQVLQRYLAVRNKLVQPTHVPIAEEKQEPIGNSVMETQVLTSVPTKQKKKAEQLLEFMKNVPGLSWSERGEMVLHGRTYKDSHIVDLVNDVLRARKSKKPTGWEVLADALHAANIPQELVGNTDRWDYMRKRPPSPVELPRQKKKSPQGKPINWDFTV